MKKYKLMHVIYGANGSIRETMYSIKDESYWRAIYGDMLDVLPEYFQEVKEEKIFAGGEVWKFVDDNFRWLEKWFDNAENYFRKKNIPNSIDEQLKGFQEFKRYVQRARDQSPSEWLKCKEKQMLLHKKEVLAGAIFSKQYKLADTYTERNIWSMSGFLEQMGRLPNESDKIKLIYFGNDKKGDRFLRLRTNDDDTEFELLSDCKIEIENKKEKDSYFFVKKLDLVKIGESPTSDIYITTDHEIVYEVRVIGTHGFTKPNSSKGE